MSDTITVDACVQFEAIEHFLDALAACVWVNDEANRWSAFQALQLDNRAAVQHVLLEAQRRLELKHQKKTRWTNVEQSEWHWLLLQLQSLSMLTQDTALMLMLSDIEHLCAEAHTDTTAITIPSDSIESSAFSSRSHMFITPFCRQSSSSRSSSSIRSSVDRMLLRSVSSYVGIQAGDTFYCQICFENVRTTDSVVLTACGHHFCRGCLKQYLTVKINDAQLHPVCFFDEQTPIDRASSSTTAKPSVCGRVIRVEDIKAIVSPEAWMKYERFKMHKENDRARDCPFCNHTQLVVISDEAESLECVCESCHKAYCFDHSNAHTGQTCAEYEKEIAAIEKINRAAISAISKPCPGCNAPVEKNGGCNHMTCHHCKTDFCWLCHAVISDSAHPAHFQWWNGDGCPGLQFDVDELPATRGRSCCAWLGIATVGIPAYSAAFVVAFLSWPWRPFRTTFIEYFTLFMNWWTQLLLHVVVIPVQIAIMLPFLPLIGFEEYEHRAAELKAARHQLIYDAFHDQPAQAICRTCEQLVTGTPDGSMCSTCTKCSVQVCWTCGIAVPTQDAQRAHFKWWHVRACSSANSLGLSLYAAFSLLLCSVPALLLTILLWPWTCIRTRFEHRIDNVFNWCLRRCMAAVMSLLLLIWLVMELTFNLFKCPYRGWVYLSTISNVDPAEAMPAEATVRCSDQNI